MMRLLSLLLLLSFLPFVEAQELAPIYDVRPVLRESAAQVSAQPAARKPVLWARTDLLVLTPHMRGLDFAASETGDALVLGTGQSHDVELDQDAGFRTQLGFINAAGWSFDFGYTHFGSEGRSEVSRPPGTGQLFSTFSHPGGPEEADTASASSSLDYDVFDVGTRVNAISNCSLAVELFAGLRWADISHAIRADYDGRDFVNGVLSSQADINAFGVRTGGEGRWIINSSWSGFASTAVAAMYGKFDHQRFESNINGTQIQVDFRDAYQQPVFNVESAVGLSYSRKSWRFSGGYELSVWTNLGDSLRYVDDIEEGGLAAMPGDLLLEGFFFRAEKMW